MARVLAIDRDLGVLEIVRVALADQGHEAILASNRTQVRRYLRSNRPDIILLTQRLDELSVLEQLQGLNLADFNGPLVVIAQNLRTENLQWGPDRQSSNPRNLQFVSRPHKSSPWLAH
jgi:DNA-binding NtrC family response regulator